MGQIADGPYINQYWGIRFPIRPTTFYLEFIWLVKFSPQHTVLHRMLVLDSLHYLGHYFWTANLIVVTPHSLETRHSKLSKKPKIIKFGPVTTEICLVEVVVAVDVNAFNAKRVRLVKAFHFAYCCLVPPPQPSFFPSNKARTCENEGCMNHLCCCTLFTSKDIKRHTSSPLVHPNVAAANLLVFFTPFLVFSSTFCV